MTNRPRLIAFSEWKGHALIDSKGISVLLMPILPLKEREELLPGYCCPEIMEEAKIRSYIIHLTIVVERPFVVSYPERELCCCWISSVIKAKEMDRLCACVSIIGHTLFDYFSFSPHNIEVITTPAASFAIILTSLCSAHTRILQAVLTFFLTWIEHQYLIAEKFLATLTIQLLKCNKRSDVKLSI